MSFVYVSDPGSKLSINGNRLVIKKEDESTRSLPIELIEGINLLGPSQLTIQCMEACMVRGIPVSFSSKGGRYYGRLMSSGHIRPEIQRHQSALYDTPFALELSKRICIAKIRNQITVVHRYKKTLGNTNEHELISMKNSLSKIDSCGKISEVIGYEGRAAKSYFQALSQCIDSKFSFHGRNRRPPKDPFNSMISLGYSIVLNEIYREIEMRGLNPYFGFVHRDAENHPTLASDLMEEWRAVLIDTTVMALINGHEVSIDQFDYDNGGCYLQKDALRIFLNKLEKKFTTKVRYFSYTNDMVDFRYGISLQVGQLIKAIETENPEQYQPIIIR